MKKLTINLNPAYDIYLNSNQLQHAALAEFCNSRPESFVMITDTNLRSGYAQQVLDYLKRYHIDCDVITIPSGEQYKTRDTKAYIEDQLLAKYYGRDTCLIAVGGGVVSDITGFVAATYCRGISAIYIPTSLLAMVDASIGGKTAVDTPFGKNLIGAFYQPKAVFMDLKALDSLSDQEYKSGLVEIIKHALIIDQDLFELLATQYAAILARDEKLLMDIIYRSSDIKRVIVEQDEKEQHIRSLLNFGHTIGHAIEVLENYRLSHGEAVAIGMVVEAYLSMQLGFLSKQEYEKIITILQQYQLPLHTSVFADVLQFKKTLTLDKKSKARQPRFVLLDSIGAAHVEQNQYVMTVPETILDESIRHFVLGK